MAFSLLLFLMVSSSLATLSIQDAALIDKICKQTQAYDLCVSALLSDARSITADLHGLATVSINLMLVNITDNNRVISELLDKAQDANMKGALGECKELGDLAMHGIQIAFQALESKDNLQLNVAADAIGDSALECDKALDKLGIRPSPLGLRNRNVFYLSDITRAISNMLP